MMADNLIPCLCAVLILFISPISGIRQRRQVDEQKVFACYYGTWANGNRLNARDIDPFICTHIVAAFAKVQVTGSTATVVPFDISDEQSVYPQLTRLKTRNPNLKTLLAVGGWSHGVVDFIKVADSPSLLNSFVKNTASYLRRFDFDGIDIDWEFPTVKSQFSRFIRAFRTEFNRPENAHLLLTSAMSAGEANMNTGYDIPDLAGMLDYILLMTYDLHGGWEGKTGHNSPLFARSVEQAWRARLNTAWAAEEWSRRGMPRNKIVVGMTTYARRFVLRNAQNNGVEAPSEWWNLFLTYKEVCQGFLPGSSIVWDAESKAHYAYKEKLWVSFDSVDAVREKTQWLMRENFGGAMVWTIDQDDVGNACGQGNYPILTTIRQELFGGSITIPSFPGQLSTVSPGTGTPPTTRRTTPRTTPRIITTGSVDCLIDPPGNYQVPGECGVFLKCANDRAFTFLCPTGLYYRPVTDQCDFETFVRPERPDCNWGPDGSITTRPTPRTTRPTIRTTRPTIRTTRPTIRTTRPTIRTTRPTIRTTRPTIRTTRPTIRTTRPTIRTTRPTIRTTTPTTRRTTTSSLGQVNCAVVPTGLYAVIGDCTKFKQCVNGREFMKDCFFGLLFDAESTVCNWAPIVKRSRSDCL